MGMSAEPASLALRPDTWELITRVGETLHKSRLFGTTSPEAAAAIILKGSELGLGMAASFELIQVIQGKPTLSPRGALALIMRSGQLTGLRIAEQADGCRVWMRRGELEYETGWTLTDARQAGLVKAGGAWETYPRNMCKWRAVGFVADVLFGDLIGGLKRADELGADLDEQGNVVALPEAPEAPHARDAGDVVDAAWHAAPGTVAPAAAVPNRRSLQALVAQFGAERVLVAAGGTIPADDAAVEAVAAQLAREAALDGGVVQGEHDA
jgi:hypothetical protein